MNNEHNGQDIPQEEDWWGQLLDSGDENDLTSPDEMELERIVQETLAENWTDTLEEIQPAAEPELETVEEILAQADTEIDATQLFSKQEMPVIQSEPKIAAPIDDNIDEEIARFVQNATLAESSFSCSS